MTWARGQYRLAKRGPVYLRHVGAIGHIPVAPIAAAFLALILGLVIVVATDTATAIGGSGAALGAIAVAVMTGAMVLSIYGFRLREDRKRFVREAFELCAETPPTEADFARMAELRARAEPVNRTITLELERAYVQLIHIIVADGVADPDELERLALTEKVFMLPESRIRAARLQGFLDVYDRAIEDDILTEEEQSSIAQIRAALDIPEREVRREMAFARQLARARSVRAEPLEAVRVSIRLPVSERAFYTTMGAQKKLVERIQRSSGREFTRRAFESRRAGNLIVTSQRLLFEAGSVTSIPLGRIVEVGVDAETKYLTVHDDKHREPYYFDVPQPYMALAYVERVLEDGASVRGRDAA